METAIQHPVCNGEPRHATQAAATQHEYVSEEHTWNMVETLIVFQLATFWSKADADVNICEQPTRSKPHRTSRQSQARCTHARPHCGIIGPARLGRHRLTASTVHAGSATTQKPSGRPGVETL